MDKMPKDSEVSHCSSRECRECEIPNVQFTKSLVGYHQMAQIDSCQNGCENSLICLKTCSCIHHERELNINDSNLKLKEMVVSPPDLVCRDLQQRQDTNHTRDSAALYINWNLSGPQSADPTSVIYVIEFRKHKQQWRVLGTGPFRFVPVKGLIPGTQYQFRVTAVFPQGIVGPSKSSGWMDTLTDDSRPAPPMQVSLLETYPVSDGTLNALIKWTPPPDRPCYYEVVWYEATLDSAYRLSRISPESSHLNHLLIEKLHFGANYTVVIVSGFDGMRNESDKACFWFQTEGCLDVFGYNFSLCAPSSPINVAYKLLPLNNGRLSIEVSWQPPNNTAATNPIDQYRVKLRKHINIMRGSSSPPHFKEILVPGNVLTAIVRGDVYEDYDLTVTAISKGGESDPENTKIMIYGRLRDFSDNQDLADAFWILLPCLFMVTFSILGLIAMHQFYRKRVLEKARNRYFESLEEGAPVAENEITLADLKQIDDMYELDLSYFHLEEILGQGAFGVVRKAKIKSRQNTWETVAIKMLKPMARDEDRSQLLQEIEILRSVGQHPHIISLIGCSIDETQPFVAVEHCPLGDLQSYLRRFRQQYLTVMPLYQSDGSLGDKQDSGFINTSNPSADENIKTPPALNDERSELSDPIYQNIYNKVRQDSSRTNFFFPEPPLSPTDLLSFSRQIAMGMEYLSKNKFIHRDLATRNILVCENKIVKISDFGLSRDVYENSIYSKTTGGRLPVKWMAYESIFDHIYTTKSDVWSFGVVLWELATLGGIPYPGVSNEDLHKLLRRGYRMDKPENCSDDVYALMRACWQQKPSLRPSFSELRICLEELLGDCVQYITFNLDVNARYYASAESDSRRRDSNQIDNDDSAFEDRISERENSDLSTQTSSGLRSTKENTSDSDQSKSAEELSKSKWNMSVQSSDNTIGQVLYSEISNPRLET